MAHGNNVWLFKLPGPEDGCACGHVWWRFLLVKLGRKGRITQIKSEVHEVCSDGHGELISEDFLPYDVMLSRAELGVVAGGVPAEP